MGERKIGVGKGYVALFGHCSILTPPRHFTRNNCWAGEKLGKGKDEIRDQK